MRRIVFVAVILALSVVSSHSYGQELKRTRCPNGQFGFKDRKTGIMVIPCKYDRAWESFEAWAGVKLNGKWGFIDKTGKEVIPLNFDRVLYFNGKYAEVKLNGKWGYSDISGIFYNGLAALLRVDREREDREREQKESFSYFSKNYVEQEMNKWLQKGEFERTDDWQQRINEDNCKTKETELRQNAEQAFIAERSKDIPRGIIAIGAYDADREVFLIKNSLYGDWLAPVPIHEAPDFRANWFNLKKTPQYEIRNDRIAYAGYKFEFVQDAVNNNVTEQPKESLAQSEVVPGANNKSEVSIQSKLATDNNATDKQHASSKVGLQAGVNFSDLMNIANNSLGVDVKIKHGIQVGLIGEIPFGNTKFALRTGLLYSQLGTNLDIENVPGFNTTVSVKITLHSLHFPAHIQYKLGNSSTTLLLHGGLFFDYYLRLDAEYEKTVNGKKVEGDSASLLNDDNLANDIGIGLGAALLIGNKCQIGAGYDVGVNSRNLMITIAFMFGK